jgi:TIR domain/PAN domain
VTDIFFSYSSADRERVRPVRDALVAQGFEVFWDQEVPTGLDWDSWIRQHLAKCKCAMAFWSAASVASDNVRHEAVVAKQQGKLISVLLESLTAQQFPMGLYAQQAANLADWNGDLNHKEWRKLRREYEAKLIPTWVRQQLDELEAELVGERARREGVERRDKTLQGQIAKEAQAHQDLKREFDKSLDEVAAAKANVGELSQRLNEANAQLSSSARRIEVAKSAARAALLTQNPIMQFGSIAAVVATLGFWTYQLIGSGPPASQQGSVQEASLLPVAVTDEVRRKVEEAEQFRKEAERQANLAADADTKRKEAEAEQQRLKDQLQRQANAVAEAQAAARDADTKRQAAEKAVAGADTARKAAEIDQQQLKLEVQRLTKAATEADTKRRDAEAEQQRLTNELQRQTKMAPEAEAKLKTGGAAEQRRGAEQSWLFTTIPSYRIAGRSFTATNANTVEECKEKCTSQDKPCFGFSLNKKLKSCDLYDFTPNGPNAFIQDADFDSGARYPR